MIFQIEISDAIAEKLKGVLMRNTKPPRQLPDGTTVIEPEFKTVGDYLARLIAVNIEQLIGGQNDPPEVIALRKQIEELHESIRKHYHPCVRCHGENPSTS